MTADQEAMAVLCASLASDRALGDRSVIRLPRPGSPECDKIFLGAWAAFRHVTTQLGHKLMMQEVDRVRRLDPLDAFVRGRDAVPAYQRWAETEALIRSGGWSDGPRSMSAGARW